MATPLGNPLDLAANEVLADYPLLRPIACQSLGSAGGFSGASLWRITAAGSAFCLKAWPTDSMTLERLGSVHAWMEAARSAGLTFVPAVIHDLNGQTWCSRRNQVTTCPEGASTQKRHRKTIHLAARLPTSVFKN